METFRSIHLGLHSATLDVFFLICTYLGLGQVPAFVVVLLYLKKETRAHALSFGVIALIVGLGFVHAIKAIIPRDRPSNYTWAHPQEAHLAGSFPSGHTTVAFCIAVSLWWIVRGTRYQWMAIVATVVAPLVAISRVYRGVHWPSDVLAGALLGSGGAIMCWLVRDWWVLGRSSQSNSSELTVRQD